MIHMPTPLRFLPAALIALMMSGCATHTPQKGATTTLPAHNVVIMDPRIDDRSLPALGEGLSKGAVTIYALDGPNAALPINVVQQPGAPMGGPRPIVTAPDFGMGQIQPSPLTPIPTGNPISITRPSTMKNGNNDPRVMLFNPDSGTQMGVKKTTRPPATDPDLRPPMLPPPLSDKTQPLKSPFGGSGVLGAHRDATTWNPPTSGTVRNAPTAIWTPPTATMGSDRRAVMTEDLMQGNLTPPTLPPPLSVSGSSAGSSMSPSPTKPPRPPRGMTY